MEYQYNIYSLEWKYLGCIWMASPYFQYKEVGDYIRTNWHGGMLTRDGKEIEANEPIECYLKLVSAQEVKK